MQTEVEGIVLKETLYSETSKVIQVLTKEFGLVSMIAKGALSIKSNLRSLTIPFLYGKFDISYKKDKLSILKSGKIIKLYGSGSNSLKLYAYMSYLSELTFNVLKENNDSEIFNILKEGLDKIYDGFDPEVIKNIIEFKYLEYLGITPNFSVCQKCNEQKDFYAIDGKNGGFICHDCYTNEELIPSNFPKIVDRFINVDIKTIKEINLKDSDKKIINNFLKEYYEKYSAVYINSTKFLSEIE